MQLAGINKISFYENKGLAITYTDGQCTYVSTDGEFIEVDYTNRPTLDQDFKNAANNELLVDYSINFLLYAFDNDELEKLTTSPYGFIPVYEMNDNKSFLINQPFFAEISELDSQVSHSWPITMVPRASVNNVDVKEVV